MLGKLGIVSYHDYETVVSYFLEKLHYLNARVRIKRTRGLVGKKNIGVVYECACDSNSLHLTARHLIRLLVKLIAKSDLSECLNRSCAALAL